MLTFERAWLNDPRPGDGRKVQAIREQFGVGETRYYQRLVATIHSREALEVDPVTTRILLDRLARRTRSRAG